MDCHFSFPLHSIHQHQTDLLRSFLLMSFSSKSALTPHCQWRRYIFRSLAFHNCTLTHPLHTSRLPASALCFMLTPLQCCSTFSWHSASPTFGLASPWEPPHHQSLCMVHFFIHSTINPLYCISFHSANIFLRTYYEPSIVLDAKETKINAIFSKLAGLIITQNK